MNKSKVNILSECALMIALSSILSNFTILKMPFGGSVTLGSMCPIIILSLRHGIKYGMLTGFSYSILQMILGFRTPPIKNFLYYILVIFLDYLIPYTSLGLAKLFYNHFKSRKILYSTICTVSIRYISSIISGIIIWKNLSPTNLPLWQYSILYNSIYMLPEIVITSILCLIIHKSIRNKIN